MNTRAHVHTQCTRTWGLGGQSFPIVLLCFPLCLDFPQKFHWETSNYYSLKEDSRKSKITFFLSQKYIPLLKGFLIIFQKSVKSC